ncbi:serine hydrolase [Glycomyces paridis]|uniref:Beta-lactamase n=1 Tax=Glycomyces paridis TaxID=2126555 RepID=A0A4V4HQ11_9ACTN|nr:serine hydrolase [Glycomyces paridis]THV32056.1 serine hydrolase [Glycomyces paridis]
MIRQASNIPDRFRPSRRTVLRVGVPAAAVVAVGASYAGVAAYADEGLGSLFGESAEEKRGRLQAELTERLDQYLAGTGTQVEASVAVERGEVRLDYNPDQTHITASIVKVELLAMVQQYWGSVEAIPADHRELLELMMTESDNGATTTLYNYLGGAEALAAAHERFGLEDTTVDSQGRWGVGWSSASDQLLLTDLALFEGVLSAEQVDLGRELMGSVIEEQAWGVSAAATEEESVWLKNGWDVESQLGGLWVVNSVGVLGGDGDDPVTLAILTSGAVDETEGIPIVEEIARITREVVELD